MIVIISKDIAQHPEAQLKTMVSLLRAIEPAACQFSPRELAIAASAFLRRLKVISGRKA